MRLAVLRKRWQNYMNDRKRVLKVKKMLRFTYHYPARCFGMNMPKSRDIQAKIPLPQQSGMNFGYVTVNGVNSNVFLLECFNCMVYRLDKL